MIDVDTRCAPKSYDADEFDIDYVRNGRVDLWFYPIAAGDDAYSWSFDNFSSLETLLEGYA